MFACVVMFVKAFNADADGWNSPPCSTAMPSVAMLVMRWKAELL